MSCELDDYDRFCESTDVARSELRAPERDYPLDMYYALGLGGEVGEVLEKVKKSHRDGVLDVRQLELELGDVMWYLSRLANFHGLTLRGVLAANIEKLSSRRDRGVLRGSGDNR
jgi:NTP pyrophosphatase (non-canonical NTP hydrolase)